MSSEPLTQPESTEAAPPPPEAFAGLQGGLAVLGAAAFVALAAAVWLLGNYGGAVADRMSGRLGDIETARARAMEQGGLAEAAIEGYRKALGMTFESRDQRKWAQRWLGELLLRENRPEEAVDALRECVAENPDYLPAHAFLCQALGAAMRPEETVQAAEAWAKTAEQAGNAGDQASAWWHAGQALEALDRPDDALAAYRRGHAAAPRGRNAYHAAKLLHNRGDSAGALRLLDEYTARNGVEMAEAARLLRAEIASAGESAGDAAQ
ncbi:MAG: tetratricopeptide repeat protein [Candidatus Hydrogenedens sp.]|nr:tetratricopeptide repeat protein [Candidatus Hydrogenedentota bacterium]NLF56194.1 tetratricopeptide repeat protein [Candidatus Hydrogenedens sp.]